MKRRKIAGLDGLRILALIGVLLFHTFPKQFPGGYFGVIIFFVISGFLAAYSASRQLKKTGSFSILSYYKKRLIRLYPALIIVVFCSVAVLAQVDPNKLANTQSEVISILFGYNNYWQMKTSADYFANLSQNSPFTHLWYIAILIQFELIWPWLVNLYRLIRNKAGKQSALLLILTLTVVSCLVMPVRILLGRNVDTSVLYYDTFCRIFSIMVGVYLGFLCGESNRVRVFSNKFVSAVIVILFIIITWIIYIKVPGNALSVYAWGMFAYTLLVSIVLLVVLNRKNRVGRYLDLRICGWISKYSYEIYLWQYPVLFISQLLGYTSVIGYIGQIAVILILSTWLHDFPSLFHTKKEKKIPSEPVLQ